MASPFKKRVVLFSVLAIFLVAPVLWLKPARESGDVDELWTSESRETPAVLIGNRRIHVKIADTERERTQGLAGVAELPDGAGMLFIFEKPDMYSFWMKGMLIPIDIIWIDEHFRVVHIEKNVSPDSFPHAFSPSASAQYVLEVPAGFSDRYGIRDGTGVSLFLSSSDPGVR